MILFDVGEFEGNFGDFVPHGYRVICDCCGFKSWRAHHSKNQKINHKCSKCGGDLTFGEATSWIDPNFHSGL